MANITITNCDTGSLMLGGEEFEDGLLTAAAAGLIPAGTILERAGDKFEPFAAPGAPGTVPAILTYDVEAAAAGDIPIRALIAGRVNKNRLSFLAGGDITPAVVDGLRDYSIIALEVEQLSNFDNPQP